MKQRFFIFFILILLIAFLAVLNAVTYVQQEQKPDIELNPNRSTYHPGSTGTLAFYTLLSETGRKVTRWRTSLETIATDSKDRPAVLIMIGPLRRDLSDTEETQVMEWVSSGGTLILIDREPSTELAMTTARWQMSLTQADSPDLFSVDASNQTQMTASTPAQKPSMPSYFSHGVNAVQPSRFASSISLLRYNNTESDFTAPVDSFPSSPDPSPTQSDFYEPPPSASRDEEPATGSSDGSYNEDEYQDPHQPTFEIPLVHVSDTNKNILVEAPFASGRIILLSDPYIVSNNGINLVDNSRLAVNLATSRDGSIAFDEYHHGYGADNNRFFQYFEGTPVIALFIQCGLLAALVFFSQSRRFARPVPQPEPDRLSKLEYVSAMAELQQRTQAYDLAIENIYSDFRRRVCSLVGLDNTTASRHEIAVRIAERINRKIADVEEVLFRCEDVIHGEPVGRNDTVSLIDKLRDVEEKLGLKRAGRKGL
jgi:hypothetical protein